MRPSTSGSGAAHTANTIGRPVRSSQSRPRSKCGVGPPAASASSPMRSVASHPCPAGRSPLREQDPYEDELSRSPASRRRPDLRRQDPPDELDRLTPPPTTRTAAAGSGADRRCARTRWRGRARCRCRRRGACGGAPWEPPGPPPRRPRARRRRGHVTYEMRPRRITGPSDDPPAELVVQRVALNGTRPASRTNLTSWSIFCSVSVRAPAAWKISSRTTVPCTSFAPKRNATAAERHAHHDPVGLDVRDVVEQNRETASIFKSSCRRVPPPAARTPCSRDGTRAG